MSAVSRQLVNPMSALARQLCMEVAETVEHEGWLGAPQVVLLLVGEDPTAIVYARETERAARASGIRLLIRRMRATTEASEMRSVIISLNQDRGVNGIILQLPLPSRLGDGTEALALIDDDKDMDGLTEHNVFRFLQESHPFSVSAPLPLSSSLSPAIVIAVEDALRSHQILPAKAPCPRPCCLLIGLPACVVSALECCLETAGCTVLSEKSPLPASHKSYAGRTRAESLLELADVIVIGSREGTMVSAQWVRSGTVIIDVGASTACAPPRGPPAPYPVGAAEAEERAAEQRQVRYQTIQKNLASLQPTAGFFQRRLQLQTSPTLILGFCFS